MIRMIKLTSYSNDSSFYLNPSHIVGVFEKHECRENSEVETTVDTYSARENVSTVLNKIKQATEKA